VASSPLHMALCLWLKVFFLKRRSHMACHCVDGWTLYRGVVWFLSKATCPAFIAAVA
jgi:hypothetical protein